MTNHQARAWAPNDKLNRLRAIKRRMDKLMEEHSAINKLLISPNDDSYDSLLSANLKEFNSLEKEFDEITRSIHV